MYINLYLIPYAKTWKYKVMKHNMYESYERQKIN
jgi:hypothetical protein